MCSIELIPWKAQVGNQLMRHVIDSHCTILNAFDQIIIRGFFLVLYYL